jgi:hypothetical protein
MSSLAGIRNVLEKRERQARRAIVNLQHFDQFRFVYTILSFFDSTDVERMLKFHEESEPVERIHFTTAAGMLVAQGYDIQNMYVPETQGGCIFAKRDGKKWALDISLETINRNKIEALVSLEKTITD